MGLSLGLGGFGDGLFQAVFDGLENFLGVGLGLGSEAGDDLALAVDAELVEVPADLACEVGVGVLAGEEGVERVLVVACDGDFGKEVELNAVVLRAEDGDVFVGAWLLLAEVVGGEAEDG